MPPSSDAIVVLDGVTKRFGRTTAVDDLDLAIGRGEFVTLLGPSGCGKSTTLRMIGGFERPDRGKLFIDGVDMTAAPPNRRPVNMVFQDYALFPHMSVEKNMSFGLELQGKTKAETSARIDELLSFLQLEPLRHRMPDQLSGGQRQRVALARALAPDPKLLLLDEPLGALDAKLRGQLQVELKDIQRRTGKTFVFVTHDQDEALTMSDRIIVMNEGRVEQDGTPETLYHRPESRFVAEFVGETNFIAAKVLSVDGEHVVVDMNGAHLSVAAPHGAPDVGRTVTAAIRPEKIVVRPFTASTRAVEHKAAGNILEAKVTARLFKGSRTLLTVAAGPGAATVLNAYDGGESASALGDKVVISWDQDAISILSD